MSGEKKDVLDTIDSSNIFDEFETDELKKETKPKDIKKKKDIYDYLSISAGFLGIIFWINVVFIGITYGYVYYQNDDTKSNSSLISPICSLFIGEVKNPNGNGNCSSISYAEKKYNQELINIKEALIYDKMSVLEESYKEENFLKSKEVIFLTTLTENKIRPLQILSNFDDLILDFDNINRGRIKCSDFNISDENILTTSCEAYSATYETNIKGFNGTNSSYVSGGSISVAASFLNFIEKQSENFVLIDKQKTFNSNIIFEDFSQYSQKTSFDLQLQFNNDNLINK